MGFECAGMEPAERVHKIAGSNFGPPKAVPRTARTRLRDEPSNSRRLPPKQNSENVRPFFFARDSAGARHGRQRTIPANCQLNNIPKTRDSFSFPRQFWAAAGGSAHSADEAQG